jgi:hypothetical protein
MCGAFAWEEEGWQPFAGLTRDLEAAAERASRLTERDTDAPLRRETIELSIFPGVPLS